MANTSSPVITPVITPVVAPVVTPASLGILTREQLAAQFGIEQSTVSDWEKYEGLPVIKIRRSSFYDLKAVTAWLRRKGKEKRSRKAA